MRVPHLKAKATVACALLLFLCAGCDYAARVRESGEQLVGSGNSRSETRDMPEFDRIAVEGAYRVEVTAGGQRRVEVDADDNLLPVLKTEVEGGLLRIRNERGISARGLPVVRVSVPDVKEISVPGASDLQLSGVKNDALKINVEGAGRLRAAGETARLAVSLSGAGMIDAGELRARQVSAACDGAGSVTVFASETLDAAINGMCLINYHGDPPTVNPQVNGLGRVVRK
jgi:hypothetical protein